MRSIIISVLLILTLGVFPLKTRAQEATFSLTPATQEVIVKPGKTINLQYTLVNNGDPATFTLRVVSFEPWETKGQIHLLNPKGPVQFSLTQNNLALNQPFFLNSKAQLAIGLQAQIPESASGDYYYTFLAQSEPTPNIEGSVTARGTLSIGSNLILTVTPDGTTETKGKIAIFDVLPRYKWTIFGQTIKIVDSSDAIPLILILQNSGKNLIFPQGNVTITGLGKKQILYLSKNPVLAGAQKMVFLEKSTQQSALLSHFIIGRYRASAQVTFGAGTPIIFANTSFIAIPFIPLFILLIVSIITLAIVLQRKNISNK